MIAYQTWRDPETLGKKTRRPVRNDALLAASFIVNNSVILKNGTALKLGTQQTWCKPVLAS